MLWRDLQCCSFAGKLFGSMTDFPHRVLHPAMSEHFMSIQAKSGLFVAVAAGPGLKAQEGEEEVIEAWSCGETKQVSEADFSCRTGKTKVSCYRRFWKLR